jgi:N-acetylmuramoyl-L-alanine amidase
MSRLFAALLFWLAALPAAAQDRSAQDLSALARLDPAASAIRSGAGGEVTLDLTLSQPVPWRLRFRDGPPRLILDAREVDWRGIETVARGGPGVVALRAGVFRPGWSRLVLELSGPMAVASAGMATRDATRLTLRLVPAAAADFAVEAARPDPPEWAAPGPLAADRPAAAGAGPFTLVLDPGHGGIDPGAEADGLTEAALVLTFARELKEVLLRQGGFRVVLTREADVFVPLEARMSIAREAGADAFLSLHADALAEGEAAGATIYTLSAEAEDRAGQALAERHDRDDLLAGVDLAGQDDLVAQVLMDMARTETRPRTDRLSERLAAAIRDEGLRMHRHPRQSGAFSVLKAADIPSALVELGFLSSAGDRRRLSDPDWRARMARALAAGLAAWAEEDAALRAVAD